MISQDAIKTVIQQQGWKRLLLAVSGGLDSICLAHFFVSHKADLGIEWLGIAHVHHGLREVTADRDAEFVQNFAVKNKVPFFLEKLDGAAIKSASGSLEENARVARYEALRLFAAENHADAILTAHHGNDQAETLYYRIRRGVSLAGLRGIHPIRKFESVNLFRPFLQVTRKDLLEYAKGQNLDWREDESNTDTKFARNQIRHQSLPHLEESIPGTCEQLCRIANLARNVYAKIMVKAESLFVPAVIPQDKWPFEARYSCFYKVLALNLEHINQVFNTSQTKPGDTAELFRLWLSEKGFRLPLREKGSTIPYPFLQRLKYKTILMEKCRNILWICDTLCQSKQNNLYFIEEQVLTDKVKELRFRQDSDFLWPKDEKIKPRKLEQWLQQQGIPRWMYDSLPLQAEKSRIFYVYGLRLPGKKPSV